MIYGLNSLFAACQLLIYRHGIPRPSIVIRELERLQGLCTAAESSGNSDRLLARLAMLDFQKRDSYNLVLFRVSEIRDPKNPELVLHDIETRELLLELARSEPAKLASLASDAAEPLHERVKGHGRGGKRNRGAVWEREVIFELGIIFRNVAGRPPGFTVYADEGVQTGPFAQFAVAVFNQLDRPIGERAIMRHLKNLDVPELQSAKRSSIPWNQKNTNP